MEKELGQEKLDSSLKLIFRASLFVFLGTILSKLFTYLYRVIIARDFGPETYGLFSLAIMILTWVVSLFSFGLYDGTLRFVSFYRGKKKTNNVKYIFKFSFVVLFFSSIISAILLYFLSDFISINIFHNTLLIPFLKILSLSLPFFSLAYLFLAFLQAYEKIKIHSFISDILFNFINLMSLIVLIFVGIKTNSIIFSYFIGLVVIFLISFLFCRKKIPEIFARLKLKTNSRKKVRKEVFSYSLPLIFLGIINGLLPNVDSFIIGYFKGASDVGIYNAAILISGFIFFVPSLFMRLFFPLITREFSRKNLDVIKELSKQVQKWIFIVNLPFFVLMMIFPGAFINLLFGAPYMAAETPLKFLAIASFLNSLSVIFYNLICMMGKSKLILIDMIIYSISALTLNLIFVPKYGISGAAFAIMITTILIDLIFFFQAKHYTSIIPFRRKMVSILLSIIPPTLLLLYIKQFIPVSIATIILEGSFFILLYILFVFITRGLDRNDFMILKSIKKNFQTSKSKE